MTPRFLKYIIISFCILAFSQSWGQVIINEFMASNTGFVNDPDYDESGDWVELYNVGTSSINLNGYSISDNISNPQKYVIAIDYELKAKEFVVIWLDDFGTGLHASFKLSADGEEIALSDPSGEIVDSLIYDLQQSNISMGRVPNGTGEWRYFNEPTPGTSNGNSSFEGIVRSIPDFSIRGGIYSSPISVTLANRFDGYIRYTLDGSEPNNNSPIYENPINIGATTIVRARIFKSDNIPGEVITHSYFIDSDSSIGKLPVISIASAPENFWDPTIGIYAQDFHPDWEIPINIELFENDGSDRAGFNERAGAKINGLHSWQLPQKMLGIYFDKSYGSNNIEYPLFFDRKNHTFESFSLRASGSDWAYTLFRDGMIQYSTQLNMDLDIQGFRPCVVYINGQYMGIHNIRSKVNEEFIKEENDLVVDNIDMIENGENVEEGSYYQYDTFKSVYEKDLSNQANYDLVSTQMDIENFTDYIISEMYASNSSVGHNVMAWKPQGFGKWRWLLFDTDRGFIDDNGNLLDFFIGKTVFPFRNLMVNSSFSESFKLRFADHLFTTFCPQRMHQVIDQFASNIESEIPKHVERWAGTSSNYGDPIESVAYWNGKVSEMKDFANVRPGIILDNLFGSENLIDLSVAVQPAKAGVVKLNDLIVPETNCFGRYPVGREVAFEANAINGYNFIGWKSGDSNNLIEKEDTWKYNDEGVDLGANWIQQEYDDSSWSEGMAELGYGDGDENTVVSYTGDADHKNITTYFRKEFSVENADDYSNLTIWLRFDDGAVVYLNGEETVRANMPGGIIEAGTMASATLSGARETEFSAFSVDASRLVDGTNVVAVEVHQGYPSSSDISFDLSLSATKVNDAIISYGNTYNLALEDNTNLVAVFEQNDNCLIPEIVTEDLHLYKDCSPYYTTGDIVIQPEATLTIDAGVEILMEDGVSMYVNGAIESNGTQTEPVIFKSNFNSPIKKWGAIVIENATSTSKLANTIIEDASIGSNPTRQNAAVSIYNSDVKLDSIIIEDVWDNPVVARYSNVELTGCYFHSKVTGDLVNVKYGEAVIRDCEFVGNDQPDTDGVDLDGSISAEITDCVFQGFYGENSDAIDIGEGSKNVLIDSNFIYNITDKGVSVGQESKVDVQNSIIVNCNSGTVAKDSSVVKINNCTYYGCGIAVYAFEKNPGKAGGNIWLKNSILSNSYQYSAFGDKYSKMNTSYSLSDVDTLELNQNNLFEDPLFTDPNNFDFSLRSNSPAIGSGTDGNIGALQIDVEAPPMVQIFAINYIASINQPELFVIINSGTKSVDLSGYKISKGVEYLFPDDITLAVDEKLVLTADKSFDIVQSFYGHKLEWGSGKLDNNGEKINLIDSHGIIIDQVDYEDIAPWPIITEAGQALILKDVTLGNHLGQNWELTSLDELITSSEVALENQPKVYPNPTTGILYLSGFSEESHVTIYNLSGLKVTEIVVDRGGEAVLDLNDLPKGIYVLSSGSFSIRIINI
ncbi:lamin tail domain-containing protein [Sunxiuqinia sp. A32]|uniref:lamin tail domain-containing protein n=1 Tax=Sunxiuqinia sp. A32 TaxID=3461496 RepID=UPI004046482D